MSVLVMTCLGALSFFAADEPDSARSGKHVKTAIQNPNIMIVEVDGKVTQRKTFDFDEQMITNTSDVLDQNPFKETLKVFIRNNDEILLLAAVKRDTLSFNFGRFESRGIVGYAWDDFETRTLGDEGGNQESLPDSRWSIAGKRAWPAYHRIKPETAGSPPEGCEEEIHTLLADIQVDLKTSTTFVPTRSIAASFLKSFELLADARARVHLRSDLTGSHSDAKRVTSHIKSTGEEVSIGVGFPPSIGTSGTITSSGISAPAEETLQYGRAGTFKNWFTQDFAFAGFIQVRARRFTKTITCTSSVKLTIFEIEDSTEGLSHSGPPYSN